MYSGRHVGNCNFQHEVLSHIHLDNYCMLSFSSIKCKNLISSEDYSYCKIAIKIISQENNPSNLRLFEAFHITKYTPSLNPQEECCELSDLLFQSPHHNFTFVYQHSILTLTFYIPRTCYPLQCISSVRNILFFPYDAIDQ